MTRASSLCAAVLLLGFLPGLVLAVGGKPGGSLSLGYRVDSLDWSISGGSGGPNILSELEWNDMDILQLSAELSGSSATGIYFRGLFDYGWVQDGVNRDSDYAGDNRTLEFSRSVNDTDGGVVMDISAGLGLVFSMGESDQLQVIPMLGLSYHQQDLRMRNGNQRVSDLANFQIIDPSVTSVLPLGPFPGLNSRYDAEWSGPWIGADIILNMREAGVAFVRVEGHSVNYSAQATWNLRGDLAQPVSFEHEANGQGWLLELGWQGEDSPDYWVWGVSVITQSWNTDAGIDRIFGAGGGVGVTGLNEVNWVSNSVNITLRKAFDH